MSLPLLQCLAGHKVASIRSKAAENSS